MKRTQARELTLLRADSLAQLLRAMVDGLRESYSLDVVSVVLLDPQHEIRHLLLAGGDRPEEFRQIFFRRSVDRPRAAAGRAAQAMARPLRGGGSPSAVSGDTEPQERRAGAAARATTAPRGHCASAAGIRRASPGITQRDFLSHLGAVAAVCIENAVNRAPPVARGHHRFSHRLAQSALFAAAPEGELAVHSAMPDRSPA